MSVGGVVLRSDALASALIIQLLLTVPLTKMYFTSSNVCYYVVICLEMVILVTGDMPCEIFNRLLIFSLVHPV